MNWDDLRYVLALAKAGSLAKAARALDVDHTTVGRRIEAVEADLCVRLFTRTPTGYVLTDEADRLLPEIQQVESAVLQLERFAQARDGGLEGTVRVTAAETFGSAYLAPRLAVFAREHPGLQVELLAGSAIFDLGRREADVAVRLFRSRHDHLVLQRAGEVAHAMYATEDYLATRPFPRTPEDLAEHDILCPGGSQNDFEQHWLHRLCRSARVSMLCNMTLAVRAAALASTGIAILPRYLADPEPRLRRIPMPDEPRMAIWLTVHKDLQHTRRVREMLDYLRTTLLADRALLAGE